MNNNTKQTNTDELAFAMTGYRFQDSEYLFKISGLDKMPEILDDWPKLEINKEVYNLVNMGKLLYNTTKAFLEKRDTKLLPPDWDNCETSVKFLIVLKINAALHLQGNSSYKYNFRICGDALHNYMIDLKRLDGWQASEYYDPIDKVDTWICKLSQSQDYMELQLVFNTFIHLYMDDAPSDSMFDTIRLLMTSAHHLYNSIHPDATTSGGDYECVFNEIVALIIASNCLKKVDDAKSQCFNYKSKSTEIANRSYSAQILNGDVVCFNFSIGIKDSAIYKKTMSWNRADDKVKIEINQFISNNVTTD